MSQKIPGPVKTSQHFNKLERLLGKDDVDRQALVGRPRARDERIRSGHGRNIPELGGGMGPKIFHVWVFSLSKMLIHKRMGF